MYLNNLLDAYHENCIVDMICENCEAEYTAFNEDMILCKNCDDYTLREPIEEQNEDYDYDQNNIL